MKLSIIITVFNREKYIERCIKSALEQDIDDYEIIIINDGSTDSSHQIINKYANKFKEKIKYIIKENGGVSSARNEGLKHATGEYITYIDSDDYAMPNSYGKIYNLAHKNDFDIVIYDANKVIGEKKEKMEALEGIEEGIITKKQYVISMPCPWNKIIKRNIIKKANFRFPEGIIYEDYAMIPTLVNYADKIYYYKSNVINYYLSDESIMRENNFKDRYLDIFKASEILKENIDIKKFKEEIEFIFWDNLLVEFSLIFYKYKRYEFIDKISYFMEKDFSDWKKNKYVKKQPIKKKLYSYIFYYKKYNVLKILQKLKHKFLGGIKANGNN